MQCCFIKGVRKAVSAGCDHHLPYAVQHIFTYVVDQVVDCCPRNVGPLLFNGCAKWLDIVRNWNMLLYTPIWGIPNMLNGWRVQWVCYPCENWDELLATWGCAKSCCNFRQWTQINSTAMGLRILLWYLCTFNMPPIKCTCVCRPKQTPVHMHTATATMGHSIHNIDISIPLTHVTTDTICHLSWTIKTRIPLWREHLYNVPDAIEYARLSTQVGYDKELQSGGTPMRTMSMQMSLPEMVSNSLFRKSLGMQTDCCSSCPGGWFQAIMEVNMLNAEVLHLVTQSLILWTIIGNGLR